VTAPLRALSSATALPRALWNLAGPLLAGLALVTSGWLYLRHGSANLPRIATTDMRMHVDFDTFWRSAVALRQHTPLYRTGATLPNLDPPVLAVLLLPLAWLDVLTAFHVFALLNAVLVVGSVIVVAVRLRVRQSWATMVVAALLLSAPLQSTVALGQVYGLLTAALTVAWVAEGRGRSGWAGVALGLAVAVKPSLAPLLLWPLGRGWWISSRLRGAQLPPRGVVVPADPTPGSATPKKARPCEMTPGSPLARHRSTRHALVHQRWPTLGAALGTGAVATAVGIVAAGWGATVDWLRLLRAVRVSGFLDNDSLAALAVRFHLPSWLGCLVAAGLLGITVYRARRRPELALWSITAAALLLAPIAWNNYLVLLSPVVPVLLAAGRWRAALPLVALPVIGIEWVLLVPPGDPVLSRLAQSLYCGMLLVYWAVLTFGRAPVEPAAATDDWSAELDDAWLAAPRERLPL
jgi:hypothetical protein